MNIALMQLFNIIRPFKKAVIFSDSTAARQSLAKADAPPKKAVIFSDSTAARQSLAKADAPPKKRVTKIKAFRKA